MNRSQERGALRAARYKAVVLLCLSASMLAQAWRA